MKNNKKSKISIIIPVYNVEKYIRKCLNSVVNQTLKNIEIVVVDDASPDNSLQIVKEFQKKDKRIKIVSHKKNKGLLQARRTGMLVASGEYIQHLDSDDWLDLNTCEIVYDALHKSESDLCHIGFKLKSKGKIIEDKSEYWSIYDEKIKRDILFERILEDKISHNAVSFISKKEIALKACDEMKNITNLTLAEDLIYTSYLNLYANDCICVPKKLYNYRLNIGVCSKASNSVEKFTNAFKDMNVAFERIEKVVKNIDNDKLINKAKQKKQKHLKGNSLYNWDKLNKKNKELVFKSLYDKKLLAKWIEILYEFERFDEVNNLSKVEFLNKKQDNNKKIAFYINRMHNGGREKVVQLLANNFSDRGWKVIVFILEDINENDYKLNSNIEKIVLPKNKSQLLIFLKKEMKNRKIKLFASHNWINEKELLMLAYLRANDIKICFSDHIGFRESIFIGNDLNIFKCALASENILNGLTCLARLETDVWRKFGLNVVFLPNPNEISAKDEKNVIKKTNNQIIWIGRLEEKQKQTQCAIKAFSVLYKKNKNTKLVIVGSEEGMKFGVYYDKLKKLSKELKCEKGIEFVGYSNNVEKYLQRANIHWLTSSYEGFPMVWVEAKSCGVPTIAYDMPWVELNGKGSITVPQGDYEAMANKTLELLENRELLNKISKDAIDDLKERFDNKKVIDKWEKFYSDIITTGKSDLFDEQFDDLKNKSQKYFLTYINNIVKTKEIESKNYEKDIEKLNQDIDQKEQIIKQKDIDNQQVYAIIQRNDKRIKQLQGSKSFRIGNLFFRSVKKPYKLITFPINFVKILLEK